MMSDVFRAAAALSSGLVAGLVLAGPAAGAPRAAPALARYPRIVSVAASGRASASIVVQTRAVAVKETGPKATVARFGEVYAWSPTYFAVRENVPTRLQFWNLQPDDMHTFELLSQGGRILMLVTLPPLSKRSFVLDFHRPGLYTFRCTVHEPEMEGQIRVLPAA